MTTRSRPIRHPRARRAAGLDLRLRVVLGEDIAIGPGKADLLEGIQQAGSIAAAARRMQMSYKRAWYLLDTMNQCFRERLVNSRRGGGGSGGAELTATGRRVLALYRGIESRARQATRREAAALTKLLASRTAKATR